MVLLAIDPIYLHESHTLQAEAPSVVFELLCLALVANARSRHGRERAILAALSGVALALGVLVQAFGYSRGRASCLCICADRSTVLSAMTLPDLKCFLQQSGATAFTKDGALPPGLQAQHALPR